MRSCCWIYVMLFFMFSAIPSVWAGDAKELSIRIKADAKKIGMGRTLAVSAKAVRADGKPATGVVLLPFVNGKRWGHYEYSDAEGKAHFMLPLPRVGETTIQVASNGQIAELNDNWIWTSKQTDAQTIYLQRSFDLPRTDVKAHLWFAVDDSAIVYLNGTKVLEKSGWLDIKPLAIDPKLFRKGQNTLSVEARNGLGPAGVLARLVIQTGNDEQSITTGTDWSAFETKPQGWPEIVDTTQSAAQRQEAISHGTVISGAVLPSAWPGIEFAKLRFNGPTLPKRLPVSNTVQVTVERRDLVGPRMNPKQNLVVQWEPWFTPHNCQFQTAEAIPLMGLYDSNDPDSHRQHLIWFIESGIDVILADWSNHIWQSKSWNDIGVGSHEIIATTTLMMDEMVKMREEGYTVPKMTLLGGVSYVMPEGPDAVRGELNCIRDTYIANPKYKGLWAECDGKPLVTILDLPYKYIQANIQLDDRFTIRYVGVCNESNENPKRGMWSWMDYAHPALTSHEGKPEFMVTSFGCFGQGGWLGPKSRGHRNGATIVEDWRYAMEARPEFVELHQFNEFAGQTEGSPASPEAGYVDAYSAEFSDDYEPTSLTASAYRSQGGWGFFYFNLQRALIDLYRQENPETTVVVFSQPTPGKPGHSLNPEVRSNQLTLKWVTIGKTPTGYTLKINNRPVAKHIKEDTYTADLSKYKNGLIDVEIIAEGSKSRYALWHDREALPLAKPSPASSTLHVNLQR